MYFVVFLKKVKTHIVIPVKWVKDYNVTFEKFMNYSVNSNHPHLIYWNGREGVVKNNENVRPDFSVPINDKLSPNEACYLAKIIKYFGKSYF